MSDQKVVWGYEIYKEMDIFFEKYSTKKILVVCGKSMSHLKINEYFQMLPKRLNVEVDYFRGFEPNPKYDSVVNGVNQYHERQCDTIIAVGGGSAIDVAKCIKLYCNMEKESNYLEQRIIPNDIPFVAVPTTAGTGSEATSFAVIYHKGEKQSVADASCIPGLVCMEPHFLNSLPVYQRKATMLDALCHAIESFWSVHSTIESREFSKEAIKLIMKYKNSYIKNEDEGNKAMLKASHLAGKAINIAKTTAGHAMCYKLTSLYGIAHGHAAALCVSKLWSYMIHNTNKCIDLRGEKYLNNIFWELAYAMECNSIEESVTKFQNILDEMEVDIPCPNENDFKVLKESVNLERLKNNPINLNIETIDDLYHQILYKGVD